MKRCSQCNTENRDESIFCIACGARLPETPRGPLDTVKEGPLTAGPGENPPPPQESVPASSEAPPPPPSSAMQQPTPPHETQVPPPPPPMAPPPMATGMPAQPAQAKSPMGLLALGAGILAVLMNCGCWFIAWAFAITAIILGVLGRKDSRTDRGLATVGMVLGIVSLAISLLIVAYFVIAGVSHVESYFRFPR